MLLTDLRFSIIVFFQPDISRSWIVSRRLKDFEIVHAIEVVEVVEAIEAFEVIEAIEAVEVIEVIEAVKTVETLTRESFFCCRYQAYNF